MSVGTTVIHRTLMKGNEAICVGAIAAGCRFYSIARDWPDCTGSWCDGEQRMANEGDSPPIQIAISQSAFHAILRQFPMGTLTSDAAWCAQGVQNLVVYVRDWGNAQTKQVIFYVVENPTEKAHG